MFHDSRWNFRNNFWNTLFRYFEDICQTGVRISCSQMTYVLFSCKCDFLIFEPCLVIFGPTRLSKNSKSFQFILKKIIESPYFLRRCRSWINSVLLSTLKKWRHPPLPFKSCLTFVKLLNREWWQLYWKWSLHLLQSSLVTPGKFQHNTGMLRSVNESTVAKGLDGCDQLPQIQPRLSEGGSLRWLALISKCVRAFR